MESPISRPDLVKKYPLVGDACIKTVLYTHSQMRTIPLLRDIMPDPWVAINPIKAGEIGINDRDMVSVESPRGEIRLKAQLTEEVTDPDTVFMPYGWGQPYTGDYPIVNILTPDMPRCPISASTANHCFLCRIRKA
jgi:anaerobic selenocysteine-containing dehydrogenase